MENLERERYLSELQFRFSDREKLRFHIDANYLDFIPQEFFDDPLAYLKNKGRDTKKDDRKDRKSSSQYKVFELPDIQIGDKGEPLMAKFVKLDKIQGQDPLFELKIMERLNSTGLPSAKPVGYVTPENDKYLILYEKIPGFTTRDLNIHEVYETHGGKEQVHMQIQNTIEKLRPQYENAGVRRKHWRTKDVVFDWDESGKIKVTPIDWEKTEADWDKLNKISP